MHRLYLPLFAVIFSVSTLRAEEPRAAWVASFDGPQEHSDEARGVALTSDGYSYVLGTAYDPRPGHGSSFVLILYRPDGTEAWRRVYEPPGKNAGAGGVGEIQVDSRDRAVAVGWGRTGAGASLFIARIDRNGRPDFLLTPPTASPYFIYYPPQLVLGSDDGFVLSATRDGDYLVQRYDASGELLWEWTYDGPKPDADLATGVALGSDGSVVVTGIPGVNGSGYTTIRLDPNGSPAWERNQFGFFGVTLGHAEVAIDSAGDVVLSGTPESTCGVHHIQTWKYSSTGEELWSHAFPSDPCLLIEVEDMALDGAGNALVLGTGYIDDFGNYDLQLLKYSSGGELMWRRAYDGFAETSDHASAVAVDADGAAYILGQTQSVVGQHDLTIVKYQSDGTREWSRTYDGGSTEWPKDIAVSAAGDVIATGHQYHALGQAADFVTVAYQQNGCAADVTGDHVVDRADADRLQAAAGPCVDLCPEDLNGDRTVDQADGEILRASMGPCP